MKYRMLMLSFVLSLSAFPKLSSAQTAAMCDTAWSTSNWVGHSSDASFIGQSCDNGFHQRAVSDFGYKGGDNNFCDAHAPGGRMMNALWVLKNAAKDGGSQSHHTEANSNILKWGYNYAAWATDILKFTCDTSVNARFEKSKEFPSFDNVGEMEFSPLGLYRRGPISRAALVMHEARHYHKSHSLLSDDERNQFMFTISHNMFDRNSSFGSFRAVRSLQDMQRLEDNRKEECQNRMSGVVGIEGASCDYEWGDGSITYEALWLWWFANDSNPSIFSDFHRQIAAAKANLKLAYNFRNLPNLRADWLSSTSNNIVLNSSTARGLDLPKVGPAPTPVTVSAQGKACIWSYSWSGNRTGGGGLAGGTVLGTACKESNLGQVMTSGSTTYRCTLVSQGTPNAISCN